ncbi:MAG: ArsA family ATPase [Acidimicrobiia bacterium]
MSTKGRVHTPVVMFTGKGGVGKSTIATAWAVASAHAGHRTLLVDFDGRSSCAGSFNRTAFAPQPENIAPLLDAIALDARVALDEYLKQNGQGRLARRLGATGLLDIVSSAVPGMREILLLGRVKAFERSGAYDRIVIDGYAAGHTLRLMSSPQGFLDAVKVGPIRNQATEALALVSDPARFSVALVTLPQTTPLLELAEMEAALVQVHGVAVSLVFVNECHHDPGVPPSASKLIAAFSSAPSSEFITAARTVWSAEHERARAESSARSALETSAERVEVPVMHRDHGDVIFQIAGVLQ